MLSFALVHGQAPRRGIVTSDTGGLSSPVGSTLFHENLQEAGAQARMKLSPIAGPVARRWQLKVSRTNKSPKRSRSISLDSEAARGPTSQLCHHADPILQLHGPAASLLLDAPCFVVCRHVHRAEPRHLAAKNRRMKTESALSESRKSAHQEKDCSTPSGERGAHVSPLRAATLRRRKSLFFHPRNPKSPTAPMMKRIPNATAAADPPSSSLSSDFPPPTEQAASRESRETPGRRGESEAKHSRRRG